jgi:hypothetical protein
MRSVLVAIAMIGCSARAPVSGASVVVLHAVDGASGSRTPATVEADIQKDPEAALTAIEQEAQRGPFAQHAYADLWKRRGMAHALLAYAAAAEGRDDPAVAEAKQKEQAEHEAAARAAFDMLLAIDPTFRLEYTQSPQTTFVFQAAIAEAAKRPAPAIDVDWKRDLRVGDAIPIDVEVIADPMAFLARATVFVRRRGDTSWRAADLDLPDAGAYRRIVLPGSLSASATRATAVELYLRAYDDAGNEVLAWASPERPREVPLRWDPPPPWYRKWWVWAIGAGTVAAVTGAIVYAAQWEPSDTVGGGVVIDRR